MNETKIVRIVWLDSCTVDEIANPYIIELIEQTSVGFLVRKDAITTVLARSFYLDKYHHFLAIPNCCIKDIKEMVELDTIQKPV